jgi:DNA polymerase III sliding clamp (beta) subunit (PCNA family)
VPTSSRGKQSLVHFTPKDDKVQLALSYPEVTFITDFAATEIVTGSTLSVYARKFYDILKSTDHTVTVGEAGGRIGITSGQTKWAERLVSYSVKDLQIPDTDESYFEPEEMVEAFKKVKYCAGLDTGRPGFFMVDVVAGKVRASDGVCYQEVRTKAKKSTFTVSNPMVDSFIKILSEWKSDVRLTTTSTHFFFSCGPDVMVLARSSSVFPNLDKIIIRHLRMNAKYSLKMRRIELETALKKAAVVSDGTFPYVELHLNTKECLLRAKGDTGSEVVTKIEAAWSGAPRILTFDPNKLLACVKSQQPDILQFLLDKDTTNRKSPLVLDGAVSWAFVNQLKMRPR